MNSAMKNDHTCVTEIDTAWITRANNRCGKSKTETYIHLNDEIPYVAESYN